MSAADCPGCGLPVATPADAGSWTPDGTVCWRGGRCEVSAADDADRSIDRLRQIAAAWHRATHVDSSMLPVHICDLDAVLADAIAERTRAAAAEAECARLTTELDAARRAATFAETERDTLRALTDSMRADNVRLRGIVAAVRHERAVRAAWLATLPACATAPAEVVRAYLAAEETLALVVADDHTRTTYREWAARHGAAMDAVDAAREALVAGVARCAP